MLEERRARLRAELTERTREHVDPDTLVDEALALLAHHLGAEQAAYAVIDRAGEQATIAREYNDEGCRATSNVIG